jgi:hypothetical protein
MIQVASWYHFLLQQLAAESYLDDVTEYVNDFETPRVGN